MRRSFSGRSVRAGSISMVDVPKLGVRLRVFTKFIEQCGGRRSMRAFSTKQVCENLLKPMTLASRKSYCEMLDEEQKTQSDRDVGVASVYIVHVWDSLFLDLVDAIQGHFSPTEAQSVVVWFDMFSCNQHDVLSVTAPWVSLKLVPTIRQLGRTVLALNSWDHPIALSRTWCLFEVYAAVCTGCSVEVAMPPAEYSLFRRDFAEASHVLDEALVKIDFASSKSSNPDEQQQIFELVEKAQGFASVNAIVVGLLREWTINFGRAEAKKTRMMEGEFHIDALAWDHCIASLVAQQGDSMEAERLYKNCLEDRTHVLGDLHPDTLSTMNNLALVYEARGRSDLSKPLFKRCLKLRRKVLGRSHPDTLTSLNNLAAMYEAQGRLRKAQALYERCFNQTKRVLGEFHPETLISMNNLAVVYQAQKKFAKARPLHEKCLQWREKVLGDHPDTLVSMNNLATVFQSQKSYDKAEPLYLKCTELSHAVLGPSHPNSRVFDENLTRLRDLRTSKKIRMSSAWW
eukprot:c17186_g1_i1.p1 GENE.c17186_g1_i1~~c17186_g1_i1.p1  ORF type:complete len:514 (+),score=121.02 c17186_g1_i1:42-1583(+)